MRPIDFGFRISVIKINCGNATHSVTSKSNLKPVRKTRPHSEMLSSDGSLNHSSIAIRRTVKQITIVAQISNRTVYRPAIEIRGERRARDLPTVFGSETF